MSENNWLFFNSQLFSNKYINRKIMKHIAIIDTGCNKKQSSQNKINGYTLKVKKGKIEKINNYYDFIGHGTAVTCILDKLLDNTQITVIKIDKKYCNKYGLDSWLYLALEYIFYNENFDVINISLGVPSCSLVDKLENICTSLKEKGTIIVAAFDNNGVLSYPAVLNSVIGVDTSEQIEKNKYFYIDSTVNIIKGMKKWDLPKKICKSYSAVCGNSFATPEISAMITNMLKKQISPFNILEEIKKHSIYVKNEIYSDISDSVNIKKAVVYPFNKEVSHIARNENSLSFEIIDYFDEAILGKVGTVIGDILNCNNTKILKSFQYIRWEDDFDTFILSHTDKLSFLINKDIKKSIVENCLKYKKNLFMFDEDDIICGYTFYELRDIFKKENIWIFNPNKKTNIHTEWGGKLYNIHCPVLCVAGTNSSQGKFTVQLSLRRYLQNKALRVCNLGTEPSSLLLGLEGYYTFGYNAHMNYNGWKNIIAVNYELHKLEQYNPDIIITGLQSRTIPSQIAAFKNYPIKQHEFIMGCAADTYVLCIGKADSSTYIKQTIKYLESIFPSKVIAICFNDIGIKMNILNKFIKLIINLVLFKKRTFYISDEKSLKNLSKKIIRYYT
jgi:hypothetical protein